LANKTCSAAPRAASLSGDAGRGRSVVIADKPSRLLAQADVAAVLLRLKTTDQRTMISRIKTLAPVIQDSAPPSCSTGHVELVARAGAMARI